MSARKVRRWLEENPGARFILTASHAELCARQIEDEEPDEDRFINSELPLLPHELGEMVAEMEEWAENGWAYEEAEQLIGDLLDAHSTPGADDDDEDDDVHGNAYVPTGGIPQVQVMPLPQEAFSEGETRTLVVWPQRDFEIHRVIVPSTLSMQGFVIESIAIGGEVRTIDAPAEMFSEAAIAPRLDGAFPVVKVGQAIEIHVRREPRRLEFMGRIVGVVSPPAPVEPAPDEPKGPLS